MRRGFTLIELLIVIGIIGVVAGIGAARMGPMLDRLAVARAVNRTTAFYNTGRMSAVWKGRQVRMELGTDSLIGVFEGQTFAKLIPIAHSVIGGWR